MGGYRRLAVSTGYVTPVNAQMPKEYLGYSIFLFYIFSLLTMSDQDVYIIITTWAVVFTLVITALLVLGFGPAGVAAGLCTLDLYHPPHISRRSIAY